VARSGGGGGADLSRLDPSTLSSRLIESVNLVKEMMGSNQTLRENIDRLTEQNKAESNEMFHVQTENRELRDRIEIIESIIGGQQSEIDSFGWKDIMKEENAK
jgi:hypothetical protein